jgi:acyl-CoA hydrolase/RimJ/RimL family protein N-acetyltransferase
MKTNYQDKLTTIQEALGRIRRGGRIFIGSGSAEPMALSRGLIETSHHFSDNPIIHIMTMGEATYTRPEYADNFRLNAFFIGKNVRAAVQAGRADYTPIFLSEIPVLLRSGQQPIDAALIQVSPPDAHGYCSLGVSVDIVKAATESARLVIAQVNRQMPRTFGDSFIHNDRINAFIEHDEPLPELAPADQTEVARRIGAHVARLIPDGATLQMGIGAIPDAVLSCLTQKQDLGIHTEMFSDGLLDLVKRGVVTGARKTLHTNSIITSFCMGTRALYDWVHENPHVLFFPSDYTNDPGVIRQNDNMVAINSAIAVDLTGQVCADSIGNRFYSGIGGQVDFLRGAARSRGGRPIIALPSTARRPDGKVLSRIVTSLAEGAGVVTSRGDVHYVVTEYGIASLHGASVTERARALIEIAHPDFRDELLREAQSHHYLYGDIGPMPRNEYPARYEHTHTFHSSSNSSSANSSSANSSSAGHTPPAQAAGAAGVTLSFRPIRSSDERRLQDFFYSHTDDTVYFRYGNRPLSMPHKRALELVHLDYEERLAFIGATGDPGQEKIVAVGRYELDKETSLAEVAFVVHEQYRGLGIASHLLQMLVDAAREHHFHGITAQVLAGNTPMRHVFDKVLGPPTDSSTGYGEATLCWRFTDAAPKPATPP